MKKPYTSLGKLLLDLRNKAILDGMKLLNLKEVNKTVKRICAG